MNFLPAARRSSRAESADDRSPEVWDFVRKQVAKGHQVYVVYPVIAENEETELKAAIKMYRELSGQGVRRSEGRAAARPPRFRFERSGHAHVPEGRVADSGRDHSDRSWRGCAQRNRDGDRARGALWPGAASPVAWAHRARRREVLLHFDDRRQSDRRRRAPPRCHGAHQRRLPDRRTRSRTARARRIFRHDDRPECPISASPT